MAVKHPQLAYISPINVKMTLPRLLRVSMAQLLMVDRSGMVKGEMNAIEQLVINRLLDIRASYGTTKYCTYYLRHMACPNPNCMYLHEPGEDVDSYTKDSIGYVDGLLSLFYFL